ncbi:MAG: excinuclease ABC subunit UvrC [Clostridia bacterium]|nr:excinuclease ABC subunit UvrC [Clostridia bacterium]
MENLKNETPTEILARLREKANSLPLQPGVYIMRDKKDTVIYVGKSKALKNRVSQYFQESAHHGEKTAKMVASVRNFDYMLTDTEMEALTLENRLIKLHQPKFNIKLKDAKSYPYIKVTMDEPYPRILETRKRDSDGARYFGPYTGAGAIRQIVKTVQKTFRVASCEHEFPKDIGKVRPCIYAQMGQCCAPCKGEITSEEYREIYKDILAFLRGSYSNVRRSLEEKMLYASENLMFEAAALYRDRMQSLSRLWQRQKVVGSPEDENDVIALYNDEICSCLAVFYVREGCLVDSDNFIFGADRIVDGDAVAAFLCDLYAIREFVPREILLNEPLPEEDAQALSALLSEKAGYRVTLRVPERGDKKGMCTLAYENAKQHALIYESETERDNSTLAKLASMLGLEVVPELIEAYDISNIGSEFITAGKISVKEAKFNKSAYRTYRIKSTGGKQDDYMSMREAIQRRLAHTEADPLPDLILLDGGKGHISTIRALFEEMGVDIPIFGMVKDEYHKTRSLTTEYGEISIAREQAVFQLIYRIQEEVHRYTVSRMSGAKEKTMRRSSLEDIEGIGPTKAAALLKHFGTLAALREAGVDAIEQVSGISQKNAQAVYAYFEAKRQQQKTNKRKN